MISPIPFILTAIISACVSVIFTFFWVKKSAAAMGSTLFEFLEGRDQDLKAQLDPILTTNSKVMGIIASKGVTQKQEKVALKHLGEDLLNKNELVLEALKGVAPGFSDYLQEHPDLVIQLAPRIDQLLAQQGGLEGILSKFGSPSPSANRPHPFRNLEQ